MHRFLDPNISNCRWPSVSFPTVSSFGDCSHAYRSCDLRKTLWFEKRKTSTAQAHDTLVTLYCLTITYDRAGFTYKSLRNHVQKYYIFSSQGGAYAPYAPCVSTPMSCAVYAEHKVCSAINILQCGGNYSATSNDMKLVHWPLMGGLLHLVTNSPSNITCTGRGRSPPRASSLYQM